MLGFAPRLCEKSALRNTSLYNFEGGFPRRAGLPKFFVNYPLRSYPGEPADLALRPKPPESRKKKTTPRVGARKYEKNTKINYFHLVFFPQLGVFSQPHSLVKPLRDIGTVGLLMWDTGVKEQNECVPKTGCSKMFDKKYNPERNRGCQQPLNLAHCPSPLHKPRRFLQPHVCHVFKIQNVNVYLSP